MTLHHAKITQEFQFCAVLRLCKCQHVICTQNIKNTKHKEGSVEWSRKLLFDAAETGCEPRPCRNKNKNNNYSPQVAIVFNRPFCNMGGGLKIGNKQQLRVPNIACIIRFGMLCQPCSSNMDNSISVATFCQFKRSGESCMFKKPTSVTKPIQLGLKVCCFTHVAQHVELKGQKYYTK